MEYVKYILSLNELGRIHWEDNEPEGSDLATVFSPPLGVKLPSHKSDGASIIEDDLPLDRLLQESDVSSDDMLLDRFLDESISDDAEDDIKDHVLQQHEIDGSDSLQPSSVAFKLPTTTVRWKRSGSSTYVPSDASEDRYEPDSDDEDENSAIDSPDYHPLDDGGISPMFVESTKSQSLEKKGSRLSQDVGCIESSRRNGIGNCNGHDDSEQRLGRGWNENPPAL